MRVVLLDLNFTLCENSDDRWRVIGSRGMPAWIELERYRPWLVDLLQPEHVVLLTARPEEWREQTLANIHAQTGWLPQEAHFKDRPVPPEALKRHFMRERVIPAHGNAVYLAIESNVKTRAMYSSMGITAVSVPKGGQWTSLDAATALATARLGVGSSTRR